MKIKNLNFLVAIVICVAYGFLYKQSVLACTVVYESGVGCYDLGSIGFCQCNDDFWSFGRTECRKVEASPGAECDPDQGESAKYYRYDCDIGDHSPCGGGGGEVGCFLPATKIKTPSGESNIESLKSGDKVLSFTPQGTMVENTVSTPITTTRDEYFEIKTKLGQTVKATAEHPFYIGEDRGLIGGIKDLARKLISHLGFSN